MRLRRIGIRSAFLVGLVLYGLVGLVVGVLLGAVSTLEIPPGSELNLLHRIGMWIVIVLPLVYGLIGGIALALAAALYNAAAALTGGLRLEMARLEVEDTP